MKKNFDIILKGNGLLIADWHIRKTERFSPTADYRLKTQPLMLLDRVKEIIDECDVHWITLLGDMVDTCTCLPQENHVLLECLKIMNSWGIPIMYILGQHDVDLNIYSKESGIDFFDRTNITALSDHLENVMYVDRKWGLIDNKYSVYFSDFSKEIKYPPEYCDLWLTHLSLGFVDVIEENEDGSRRFGIMAAGDIHDHFQFGHCYTVGTPYQHKAHEQPMGVVGIIEVTEKGLSFYRKPTDTDERKFLRFDPPVKKKLKVTNEKGEDIIINSVSELNIKDEIFNKVKEAGVDHLHKKISDANAPDPINFNFKIKKLRLKNYRSVKELELNFDDIGRIALILGSNGAGKSTLIYAIRDVCFGNTKTINSRVNKNAKKCEIELTLEYEGRIYTILRGNSLFKFFIDGEEQSSNNTKSLEALMKTYLPFLDYLYLFVPPQKSSFFDSQKCSELIKSCLNLDLFDYYLDEAVKLKKLYSENANIMFNSINVKTGELNIYFQERDSLLNKIDEYKKIVKHDIKTLKNMKNEFVELNLKKNKLNTSIKVAQDSLKGYESMKAILGDVNKESLENKISELEIKKASYDEYVLLKKEHSLAVKMLDDTIANYNNMSKQKREIKGIPPKESLEELEKKYNDIVRINKEIEKERTNYFNESNNLVKKIESLKEAVSKGSYICPECGSLVEKNMDDIKKSLLDYENSLANLEEPRDFLDSKIISDKIAILKDVEFNLELEENIKSIIELGKARRKKVDDLASKISKEVEEVQDSDIQPYRTALDLLSSIDVNLNIINNSKKMLLSIDNKIKELLGDETQEVYLSNLEDQITNAQMLEKYELDLDKKIEELKRQQNSVDELTIEYQALKKDLENWDTYINLMDYSKLNSLPYKLIDMLVTNFNTDEFRITTTNTLKNGNVKFQIDLQIKDSVEDFWINYEDASGGQQMLLELFLFSSIASYIGGIGLIAFDETLGVASLDVYNKIDDIVGEMMYNNILIISHSERISCYNNRIVVKKKEDGYSSYEII